MKLVNLIKCSKNKHVNLLAHNNYTLVYCKLLSETYRYSLQFLNHHHHHHHVCRQFSAHLADPLIH